MSTNSRFHQLIADAKTRIIEILPADAAQAVHAGAVLIDVREAEDFQQRHAEGAVHLSKGVIELEIEDRCPDVNTPIICYCGGGSRSALAADNLQKMGYSNVKSLTGGLRGWIAAGLPVRS